MPNDDTGTGSMQVEFSEALHPEVKGRDAALFEAAGLLRDRAVMAHATCLTDSELKLLADRGTAVAHCPLSNFFFGDRIFHVRHALRVGVKVSRLLCRLLTSPRLVIGRVRLARHCCPLCASSAAHAFC